MATSFKREPKMRTTEPSVDEVGHGMKRGGHAKKHMAMGGALPMAAAATPVRRPNPRAAMLQAAMAQRPMMRKKGGEVESKAQHKAEMNEMHKIEKELKHHESMKAGKAHHGLKKGGKVDVPGGLLGGIEAYGAHSKGKTGDIEGPGYKHGGKAHHKAHHISGHPEGSHEHHKAMAKHHAAKHAEGGSAHHKKMHEHHKAMCKGGKYAMGGKVHHDTVAEEAKTRVVEAKQRKSISSKTGDLEGVGYKHGGHAHKKHHYAKGGSVTPYENTEMHEAKKHVKKAMHTGEIKQSPAGYKHGGHVSMKEHSAKYAHGHMHTEPMKRGGKCNY
jgi:hypothetical protein